MSQPLQKPRLTHPCRNWLAILVARYDDEVLRSPSPAGPDSEPIRPLDAEQQRAWGALESWCQTGVGTGRTPFWRPSQLPDVPVRFSLAVMVGEDSVGRSRLVDTFALHLDRNDELAELSAASKLKGWQLKLATKWHELWWWRKRHPRQPWDCGYLMENSAAMARLARFRPRRPTLIIADQLRGSSLEQALQALNGAASDYRHPVRLLVLDAALPSMLKLRFDADAQRCYTPACSSGPVSVIDFAGRHFQDEALQPLAEDHA
ncbi:hypothetical protein [Thauera sp. SDU_THAU2]|uniref:hypothetical protein n=1 Tax=Thauera sp. SDU_THAU2 TaxID=3136633 RepID=UPI00311ED3A3